MAGKHETTEPSWRPLAQKLSGLIVRQGSAKSKKLPETTDEKSSVFKFKKQKRTPSPEGPLEFKPLEVDLDKLEAIHLAEGWLDKPTQNASHDQEQQPPPPTSDNSTTPIADLFASKSVLDITSSGQLNRPSSPNYSVNGRRPLSMVENQSITYVRTSADLTSLRQPQAAGSVLDRGRPVEPKRFVTDPLPKTKGLRQDLPPQSSTTTIERVAPPKEPLSKPLQRGSGISVTKQNVSAPLRPSEISGSINRHSMYAMPTPSFNGGLAKPMSAQAPRSASAMPLDRIKAWQKSVTSAPTSAPSNSNSASTLAPNLAAPSQGAAPVRRVSTRGVGNRLAWIRELEEKKSSSLNRDIGVLKKQSASVSDRLAMFENKQAVSRPPPLTRSNSTTSRLSSVGLESASSAHGNVAATPRTSIDTVQSSHRTSSVMNYYDDSFREKMESMVSGYATDKDKSDAQKKQRVTSQFVPVKPEKGEEEPATRQLDAGTSEIQPEKTEEVVQCPPVEAGTSNVEPEEKEEVHRPNELGTTASSVSPKLAEDASKPSHSEEDAPNAGQEKAEVSESSPPEAGISNAEPEKAQVPETLLPEANTSNMELEKGVMSDSRESETSTPSVEIEKTEDLPKPHQPEIDASVVESQKVAEDIQPFQEEADVERPTNNEA
ncbi:hypothetical protein AB5N19_04246 [Seiridium cardinale]